MGEVVMFIYLIVNSITGKYYVGQHKGNNLTKYLQQKFNHAQTGISTRSHLYNSMRAHPDPKVWSIHALRSDIQTRKELNEIEQDFIKFLKSQDSEYGYNICRGGEGFTGPVSQESRQRMSQAQKKRWSDNKLRAEKSETSREVWAKNPTLRAKVTKAVIKTWANSELRTLRSEISKKLWDNSDFRKMVKESRKRGKKWKLTPQGLEKIKRYHMGIKLTDESRKKISGGIRRAWIDGKYNKRVTKHITKT
jgi:hypothetical protein